MHACYEDSVMIFSLLFIVNFLISQLLCFLLIFDLDLLSSCSGRSSIFESPEREDLLVLEVTAETGLWYRLLVLITWFPRVVTAPCAIQQFALTVWKAFSKARLLLANIFKDFQWFLPRFFNPYHMRSKLFHKEVSFTFLQYVLIFLKRNPTLQGIVEWIIQILH